MMNKVKMSQRLTESALMLALTAILSLLKIIELPYGGSVTFASMLPMVIISYRYGFLWGALSGFANGLIQLLLGMNTLSYATSFVAAIAIVVLDYLLAFMSTSAGAVFRKLKSPVSALTYSAALACAIRYILHVISGCTVWAGLSIPTSDALVYSLIYNATYMIPETIVTVAAAIYISSIIDFRQSRIRAFKGEKTSVPAKALSALAGLVAVAATAVIAALVFSHLQNAETGAFDISGIANVDLTAVIITASAAVLVIAALMIVRTVLKRKA